MSTYVYQPTERAADFPSAVETLRRAGHRVVEGGIDNASPGRVQRILEIARDEGLPFTPSRIDVTAYTAYVERAGYRGKYRDYYAGNQVEKSLEHFVGLTLLAVNRGDVFVDLASENSPVPDIYRALTGCTSYRQDIMYPPGIKGDRIGGDAATMPVPDGFFTKATLTCSLEHFEQDADARLFRELARVLRPGGKVCVAPYYCYEELAVQTDPLVSVPAKVPFDAGVPVHCAPGWNNRHGRFYSPRAFRERIMDAVGAKMRFDFHHLVNAHEVDPTVYLRFAVVATRN
jgi:SAM-dependent methyltransferase